MRYLDDPMVRASLGWPSEKKVEEMSEVHPAIRAWRAYRTRPVQDRREMARYGDDLVDALEAERDYAQVLAKAGTEWARIANAEREARRQDREAVDAGLRRIGNCSTHPVVHRIARDLLERP